ncbi:MAG: hypothetical protein PHD65_06295 [Gallionella sp.]|nr:hypothetical protein [Gallionella sp.]
MTKTTNDTCIDNASRSLKELQQAEDFLYHQIWFNRNKRRLNAIQETKMIHGEISTIQQEAFDECGMKTLHDVVQRYGKENFGPWDDFEWGMINGKLSAIRWVLGDDWDVLDT